MPDLILFYQVHRSSQESLREPRACYVRRYESSIQVMDDFLLSDVDLRTVPSYYVGHGGAHRFLLAYCRLSGLGIRHYDCSLPFFVDGLQVIDLVGRGARLPVLQVER